MATKVNMTPAEITSSWKKGMVGSISKIQAGIAAVTVKPWESAIAAKDKMLTNLQAAMTNGRYEAGCRSVNLNDWKANTSKKVGERMSGGVEAATAKHQNFSTYLVSTLNQILPTIATMPDATIEDSVNRVRALMMHMHDNR